MQSQLDDLDLHTTPLYEPVQHNSGDGKQVHWATQSPTFPRAFKEFEGRVEQQLLNLLQIRCENENDRRSRQIQQASGFFGVGRDEARLAELRQQKTPACARLEGYGYRLTHRLR